ncbi:MAG: LptF/LptG family permease [Chitinophagaceae bacterium]|nr:LptF/LptG family permease [Chitinophagaceae bacterium]
MKKIDWYILKKFLSTFFFAITLLTIIAVVIDISEKTDDFVKSKLGFQGVVTQYYFGFVPHIIALLFPLFIFIAVIFFTSKMAGRSEIIAILASGTTYNRWLRPYFIGGVLLGGLLWFANQYIIPRANEIRTGFEAKYIDANSSYEAITGGRKGKDLYFKIDSFTYAGINNYDTATKTGGPFFMNKLNGTHVTENIRAETLRWDTAKKSWILQNLVQRKIDSLKEKVVMETERQMNFSFRPFDLKRDDYAKNKLTSPELKRYIQLEEQRGSEGLNELKVERYKRDATPFAVLLLTLIGALVAGRKVRGGSGAHLALGVAAAVTFVITDRFSTIFSTKGGLDPLLAAWIPNMVFCLVALYIYKKAPK